MDTLPNFLIIGAAKSGTTSLYSYLGQHPQVFTSPVKEPKFFALEGERLNFGGPGDSERMKRGSVTCLRDYQRLFASASGHRAIGEASTLYLYSPEAARRISRHIPDVKLIAILRNPADRAYSNFLHHVRNGIEPLTDFAEALEAEEKRIKDNWSPSWHYVRRGFYHDQLCRYFESFRREQVRVFLYEDLAQNPEALLRDVFDFLGVDNSFPSDISRVHNASGMPRYKAFHRLLTRSNPLKDALKPLMPVGARRKISTSLRERNLAKSRLSPDLRSKLTAIYRDDISKLQKLIDRDLSCWLE